MTVVMAMLFADMVCQGMVYPSMPSLIRQLGGLDAQSGVRLYGLLTASYFLAELFGGPVLGLLSDRRGRRPVLILSALSASVCYLVSAVAPSVPVLFLGYALAGLTSAMMVVVNASIADVAEPDERMKAFGMVGAVFGIAFVIGPVIGALIAPLGLRAPFFLSSGIMVAVGLTAAFLLPESLPAEKRSSAGFTLQAVLPWESIRAVGRYPVVRGLALTVMANALAMHMLITVWVPSATYRFGLDEAGNGWLLASFGLAMAFAQAVIVPWLGPKLGNWKSLAIGLVVSVAAMAGYGWAPSLPIFAFIMIAATFGALDEPAFQAIITDLVSEQEQGAVQGGLASLGSLMGLAGPILGTTLFSLFTGPRALLPLPGITFYAGAVLIAAGGLWAVLVVRPLARRHAQA